MMGSTSPNAMMMMGGNPGMIPAGGMMMTGYAGYPGMMPAAQVTQVAQVQQEQAFGPTAFTEPYDFCRSQAQVQAQPTMIGQVPMIGQVSMMGQPTMMYAPGVMNPYQPMMMVSGGTYNGAPAQAQQYISPSAGPAPTFSSSNTGKVKISQNHKSRKVNYERKVN